MGKQHEKIKKQLLEIADALNAFDSDAVQVKIMERVMPQLERWSMETTANEQIILSTPLEKNEPKISSAKATSKAPKPPGQTKVMNLLLKTDFFDAPRSIAEITDYCNENYEGTFYTYQTSGILLSFIKRMLLVRRISEQTNRYVYQRPRQ